MTTVYFILEEHTTESLSQAVTECMERHQARPQGGVAFHGSVVVQAMTASIPQHGLVSNEARCSNHECRLRHRCRRWLSREDPWRFERPIWRHGGESCDWKLLLPEDTAPTV